MKIRNIALSLALLKVVAVADVPLSLNEVVQDSITQGEWKYYTVNGGASSIKLYNLTSDLDLHVKSGSRPTADNWDCRPYAGGSSEEVCTVSPNEVIYIGVRGYNSGDFSLIANGSSNQNSSSSSSSSSNLLLNESDAVGKGEWKYYTVNGGATSVRLHNLTSDLDLHVKSGSRPTADNWDCRPYAGGTSEEICSVNPSEVIYIGVHGYNSGNFTLDVIGDGTGSNSNENQSSTNTNVTQALENARTNLGHKQGYVYWNGVRKHGVWATYSYTYCARFVRMSFGEPKKYGSAKSMYNHFNNLGLIHSYGTPPMGAVVFYDSHYENGWYGHVGISDGNGYQYSADSTRVGVRKKGIYVYRANYLGYVTADEFKNNH